MVSARRLLRHPEANARAIYQRYMAGTTPTRPTFDPLPPQQNVCKNHQLYWAGMDKVLAQARATTQG